MLGVENRCPQREASLGETNPRLRVYVRRRSMHAHQLSPETSPIVSLRTGLIMNDTNQISRITVVVCGETDDRASTHT